MKKIISILAVLVVFVSCNNESGTNSQKVEFQNASVALDYFYTVIATKKYENIGVFFKEKKDLKQKLTESLVNLEEKVGKYKTYGVISKTKTKGEKQILHTFNLQVSYEKMEVFVKIAFVESKKSSKKEFLLNTYNQYNTKEELINDKK